jgi:hypothetical protein
VSGPQKTSIMRGAWETNAQEKETAATFRRAEPHANVDVGNQTTALSRAVNGENPSAAQEGRQNEAAAEQQRAAASEH